MADRQRRRQRRAAAGKALARGEASRQGRQRPRSRWLLGMVPVLAIAFFGFWAFNRPSEPPPEPAFKGGPRIAVDRDSYDFGYVPVEKERRYTFTIRNVGDQVLRLEKQPLIKTLEGC